MSACPMAPGAPPKRAFHPASLSTTDGPRFRSAGPNVRPCPGGTPSISKKRGVTASPCERRGPPRPAIVYSSHCHPAIPLYHRRPIAALPGGHPKYFEEARRDGFALRAARVAAPGDRILLPLPSGDPVERAALAVEDLHIAIAGETLGLPAGGLPDGRQARGIAKGQRAQQDSVHQAEDQRIGANPQGQQ